MCIAVSHVPTDSASERHQNENDERGRFNKVARRFRGSVEYQIAIQHCRDNDSWQVTS